MAYFIFNPQTNQLEDSDNPTPIRQNLGQKLLASGGLARKGHFAGSDTFANLTPNRKYMLTGESDVHRIQPPLGPVALGTAVGTGHLINKGINYLKDNKEPPKKLWDRTGTNLKPNKPKKEPPKKFTPDVTKELIIEEVVRKFKENNPDLAKTHLSPIKEKAYKPGGPGYEFLKKITETFREQYGRDPSNSELVKYSGKHRDSISRTFKKYPDALGKLMNKDDYRRISSAPVDTHRTKGYEEVWKTKSKKEAIDNDTIRFWKDEVFWPSEERKQFFIKNFVDRANYGINRKGAPGLTYEQLADEFNMSKEMVSKVIQLIKNDPEVYLQIDRPDWQPKDKWVIEARNRIKEARKYLKPEELKAVKNQHVFVGKLNQFIKDNPLSIKNYPNLLEDIEMTFTKDGELKRVSKSDEEIIKHVLGRDGTFSIQHGAGKATGQRNLEYVNNRHLTTRKINSGLLRSFEEWVKKNNDKILKKDNEVLSKIAAMEEYLIPRGLRIKIGDKYYGAPASKMYDSETGEHTGFKKVIDFYGIEEFMDGPQQVPFKKMGFAQGGIVPRIGYRDGPTLGDARGWENMLDKDNPETMAKLEALKVLQDQQTAEYRNKAHEKRFLHRSDDYYTSQDESFIPHYVKDVAKTTFGTDAGRKYFGSKLAEGAIEGTEWLVMQIPHLLAQTNPIGLMKMQKKMDEGNFSWMDLLYEPKLGEKLGMNDYQQKKLEELRELAIAEGKPGIPQGVETLGTTGELGAMFADPFMMYGAYRKLAPHLKTKKRGIEEQVDEGKRDTLKTLGTGGLMVALAKIFPGIFKGGKAKVASKVAKTNYVKQFGNVRGMPDWFPSFMLKATQKGKLKSLPDRDYIEPMVYEIMLPVKTRLGKGKIQTKEVPVTVTQNPRDGTMTVSWTGTDNFGDEIQRTIDYTPGQTGTQNYAADEYGRGVSKEEVVIQDPEFNYTEPDYSSMGPEDTSPDSASFLDIHDEADEIVEAMEEFVKGSSKEFKKKAADEFRLYNQTDEHFGDATGHQTPDGDWVSGDDNMPFPSYDKEIKDVYHPLWDRKKKAMGGVASGPPPLSGPVPQGLPSLQPGDIYNEWIK